MYEERGLLHIFRFYDGDQEKLFSEAHVVSPYRKNFTAPKVSLVMLQLSNEFLKNAILHLIFFEGTLNFFPTILLFSGSDPNVLMP